MSMSDLNSGDSGFRPPIRRLNRGWLHFPPLIETTAVDGCRATCG